MKRLVTFLVMMLILIAPLLSGCGYIEEQLAEAYSEGYEAGHNEGYNKGYEKGKLYFYYVKPKQRYGVDDLEEYLNRWQWSEGTYVAGKFDCSEMSAYIERRLENEGYHTIIVSGEAPRDGGKHSWLLVETSKEKYMPVEAAREGVPWQVVDWSNPYFDNYFVYDREFETIQDALKYQPDQFNWWEE